MNIREPSKSDRPIVFCLHFLGGSAREWEPVALRLEGDLRLIAIDLPGFGDASNAPGYSVAEMATYVERIVREHAPRRCLIAGHSMGAKIAAVIAHRAESGADNIAGLEGLVLLAGSPPSPEPMDERRRQEMLAWFSGTAKESEAEAHTFIATNSETLDPILASRAVADVLRANRNAWVAWLERGSREDWSQRIDIVHLPTLVIAGADDGDLGPEAQERLMVPHFASVRTEWLPGARHLLPMERPDEVARLIGEHVDEVDRRRKRAESTGRKYRDLIASARVGSATRHALEKRGQPDDPQYRPVALRPPSLAILRAVVDHVIPQQDDARIDLAARIDAELGASAGDGWRFAELPPDRDAYTAGLITLDEAAMRQHGHAFETLDAPLQEQMLTSIASGSPVDGRDARDDTPDGRLSATQLQLWFEDVRAAAVRAYVSHPKTLASIGFSGIANGGDGSPKSGFARVGVGEREPWEPLASMEDQA